MTNRTWSLFANTIVNYSSFINNSSPLFTSIYLYLLLVVVLFSWIASVYGLILPSGEAVPSLLSSEAIRWFVRHSVEHISAAPIVQIVLVLIMISVLRNCGLVRYVGYVIRERKLPSLSRRQQYALRVALVLFGVCVALLLWGIVPIGGNLLSVTGHIARGPLASGWLFILLLIVCVPCIIYGRMAGIWHSEHEVVTALAAEIGHCSGYFVTLVVASQLMAAIEYVHAFELLGWGRTAVGLLTMCIYGVPLVVVVCRRHSKI